MKLLKTLIMLALGLSMTACFNTQEDLWLEADGSGRHELSYDLGNMISFIKMGVSQKLNQENNDSTLTKNKVETPEILKKIMTGISIDTVISISDLAKKGIEKEGLSIEEAIQKIDTKMDENSDTTEEAKTSMKNLITRLLGINLHVQSDLDKNILKFGINQQFDYLNTFSSFGKDIVGVFNFFISLDKSGKNNSTDKLTSALMKLSKTPSLYELDGKVLKIRRKGYDLGELQEDKQSKVAMLGMFMGGQSHKLYIHLPGKIKKSKFDQIKRIDKRTILIETPISEMYNPEKNLDVEVTFKRRRKWYKKKE